MIFKKKNISLITSSKISGQTFSVRNSRTSATTYLPIIPSQHVDDNLLGPLQIISDFKSKKASQTNKDRERFLEHYRVMREINDRKPLSTRSKSSKLYESLKSQENLKEPLTNVGPFQKVIRRKSLVEDRHKAEVYQQVCEKLDEQWKSNASCRGDRMFDVMADAIREDLRDTSRPTLVNELADYDNPYMMKKSALERLMHDQCVRNALDESQVETVLNNRPDLIKLRLKAKPPPEVLEPLHAFRGDTEYHFDAKKRLEKKCDGVNFLLDTLELVSSENESNLVAETMKIQKKKKDSDKFPEKSHPFKNHIGFESAVPWGYTGGLKMGKPRGIVQRELARMRYPTLQRVAHHLPSDWKYRSNVMHSINVLERSRGWDFESKVKAINTMKEVYDNMPTSRSVDETLDKALPIFRNRGCGMTRSTFPKGTWRDRLNNVFKLPRGKHMKTTKKK
eukprot:GHVL01024114.1.p1 GENE.GHVL01024114.1~~GHVL01024114.1.p1  ORF type:complete len:451 (+),score=54.80 GHVL01024114.1:29-1381(+)